MIDLRPFARLGGGDHGWLRARHHFSFGDYHDPQNMGWGPIRVWNDDESYSNTIAVRIRQLRQKVDDGHAVRLIHTVYGQGYVLRAPESEEDRPAR